MSLHGFLDQDEVNDVADTFIAISEAAKRGEDLAILSLRTWSRYGIPPSEVARLVGEGIR